MTFTLSTKCRRVCAHPTSPFPDPAHSALLLDSCLVPHFSRHSPSRRWAVRTAEVSPRRRRRLQTVAAGGGASVPPPPLALQLRRAARRAAAPKAQRWPAAVAWRDACPPPVCWYHRAWHACHGARSLWQWPARCRSPTGPSQLPPTQRRLGCWLPSSFVRGRPPRRPERCRPRARRERRSSRRRAACPRRRAPSPARRRGAWHHWRLGGGRRRRGKAE